MEPLGGSGCGDARGDPTPVVFCGKFWCLSDEDDDRSMEGSPKSKSPMGYRPRSPEDRVSPSARFNGGGNRYQRHFNNNVNPPPNLNTQVLDATNVVATTSGGTDALLAPHIIEASPAENVVIYLSGQAQKKIDKVQCLRCGEYGHFADACVANLCLYCEKTTHESKDCPLHAMPKPVAITYGVSRNALMFHEVPASSEVTFKHDSGKLGKISVSGGSLSAEDIVKELEWLISCNHQWELRPTDDGSFKVLFPSKADLARMTKIINVPVPGTSMFLQFEEWSATDVDRFYLTPVWVRVHGVCYKERCDYLSLFGVGSLIGKTKEVDMAFTRTHSMARMLVEVTRVEHIPTTTVDHTYEGEGYVLIFKVEGEQKNKSDVHMQDVNPSEDPKDGEGKDNEDSGADPKDGPTKLAPKAQPIQPKTNNAPTKQVQHVSLPVVHVGKIDCYDVAYSKSESKASTIVPRRLWGDSDNEDEDSLPPPLPRVVFEAEFHIHTSPGGGGRRLVEEISEAGNCRNSLPLSASSTDGALVPENGLPGAGTLEGCKSMAAMCKIMSPARSPAKTMHATKKGSVSLPSVDSVFVDDTANVFDIHLQATDCNVAPSSPPRSIDDYSGTERLWTREQVSPSINNFHIDNNASHLVSGRKMDVAVSNKRLNVQVVGQSVTENLECSLNVNDSSSGVFPEASEKGRTQPEDGVPLLSAKGINLNTNFEQHAPFHSGSGLHSSSVYHDNHFTNNVEKFGEGTDIPTSLYGTSECISRGGTGVFLGGRLSVDEVVAFGGVSMPSREVRSSKSISQQPHADATQLERAQNLAKAKYAVLMPGTPKHSRFSLGSISDDDFLHRAKKWEFH
ncbi:hypothetical protein ACQ4PT_063452 [Festuca glaucescens]